MNSERPLNGEFLRLLSQHDLQLSTFVHSLIPHWQEAEDVLQETRVRLWEQFERFKPGTDFGAWSRSVARYMVMAWQRDVSRERARLSDALVELLAERAEAGAAEAEAKRSALRECVRRLGRRSRELLRLCYGEGRKIKDAAAAFGASTAATYAALGRVRRSLRACIEQRLREEPLA